MQAAVTAYAPKIWHRKGEHHHPITVHSIAAELSELMSISLFIS